MDIPVDGADAFVLTATERALDLQDSPVLIHAASLGLAAGSREDQMPDIVNTSQRVAARALWSRSDLQGD
jgi:hypothetical protein